MIRRVVGKLAGVGLGIAIAGALIGFYIANWLLSGPPTYTPAVDRAGAHITIQTVAAVGPKLSPNENWVSYLIRKSGKWERSTIWTLPANTLVHVTVYQFDGDSGLRNAFLAQTQGLVGQRRCAERQAVRRRSPRLRVAHLRHPQLGVLVPLQGVADNAKNQCESRPATRRRWRTTRSPSPSGRARRARTAGSASSPAPPASQLGFGGPMQTIGYMDGFINVV